MYTTKASEELPIYRLLLILLILLCPAVVQAHAMAGKIRVAILPFSTPEGAMEMRQYGEGTMDSLITGLKNIPDFIMIDRGRIEGIMREQAFAMTGFVDPKSAVKVGKILQAQVLVTGSIQNFQSKYRITANFTDVESGEVKDSKQVTGSDIFALQDQLAGLFIKGQNVTVTAAQIQRVTQVLKSTSNLAAYDAYLRGRAALMQANPTGFQEAVTWFQKSIQIDPRYALGYAGLGDAYAHWSFLLVYDTGKASGYDMLAIQYIEKAIALNPSLAEVHSALAHLYANKGRFTEADAEARKALEINPNDGVAYYTLWKVTEPDNPDSTYIRKALELQPDLTGAHNDRGVAYETNGNLEAAIREYKEALRLAPRKPDTLYNLGQAYSKLRRWQEAISAYKACAEVTPEDPDVHFQLGSTYAELGQWRAAVQELETTLRLAPSYAEAQELLTKARAKAGTGR